MFGLTNAEGNHGEDVKEYYFYLDATPTSSYLKYRYRYPLGEYPYADLLRTNADRGRLDFEYELLDTGIFDDNRFVDVDVEYAKAAPDDIHVRSPCRIAARRRRICICCRRCGSATPGGWTDRRASSLGRRRSGHHRGSSRPRELELRCDDDPQLLFTENETNTERLWGTPQPART